MVPKKGRVPGHDLSLERAKAESCCSVGASKRLSGCTGSWEGLRLSWPCSQEGPDHSSGERSRSPEAEGAGAGGKEDGRGEAQVHA